MSSRDAALASLDAKSDAVALDAVAASELFGVVDVLDAQPPLRRSLSDPSTSSPAREELAAKVFGSHLSAPALQVFKSLVGSPGLTGRRLIEVVERQAVRGLLRLAKDSGVLARVQDELFAFASTVNGDPQLGDVLRNRTHTLESRRAVVSKLVRDKVHPISAELLERATAARIRTLPLTVDSYLELAAGMASQQIARVTTARALDEARLDRLRRALEAQAGGPVVLQVEVDPDVLGGLEVQLGDHIIESTVAGRLEQARRLLLNH